MKQAKNRKWLVCLLAAAMIIAMLPVTAFGAESQSAIPPLNVNSSTVAFGGRTWWVIGDASTGVYPMENSITLLAKEYQSDDDVRFREGQDTDPGDGSMIFHKIPESEYDPGRYYGANPDGMKPWQSPNEYAGSTLQQKMETVANSFSAGEQAALNPRTIEGVGAYNRQEGQTEDGKDYFPADYFAAGQSIENQRVWSLSHTEAREIGNDSVTSYGKTWWLRSSYRIMSNCVLQIRPDGKNMYYTNCDYPASQNDSFDAARPALSLNLSSVLFASAASAEGKPAVNVGDNLTDAEGVTIPVSDEDSPIKFTMKDDSQSLTVKAAVNSMENQATQSGSTLSFHYENATIGANQYISCIMTGSDGAIRYYGKLADCGSVGSGTLEVPMEGVADGTYTLQVFAEQENGEMETDLCSEPIGMTVTVQSGIGTVSNFGGTILHDHSWSDTWSGNENHHWHECLNGDCPVTDHSQKDGYELHEYNRQVVSDTYHASNATCTEGEKYYYSCICGARGSQTFTSGEAAGHGETEILDAKEATCTQAGYTGDTVCKVCGDVLQKGVIIQKLTHIYQDGRCTVCGAADPNWQLAEQSGAEEDSPQTDDNSNLVLWIALAFLSASTALLLTIQWKRQRR